MVVGRPPTIRPEDLPFQLARPVGADPRSLAEMEKEYIERVLEQTGRNISRSARILGAQVPERYPRTRTSHALAFSGIKSWSKDTALRGRYRYFTDTWDIKAHTFELGISRYLGERWTADLSYRFYTQDGASFYSDDFDGEYNYMSRDKELSDFDSHALGGRLTWSMNNGLPLGLDRANLTLSYEYVRFDYDNFTDIRNGDLYEFSSQVFQLYFTSWY